MSLTQHAQANALKPLVLETVTELEHVTVVDVSTVLVTLVVLTVSLLLQQTAPILVATFAMVTVLVKGMEDVFVMRAGNTTRLVGLLEQDLAPVVPLLAPLTAMVLSALTTALADVELVLVTADTADLTALVKQQQLAPLTVEVLKEALVTVEPVSVFSLGMALAALTVHPVLRAVPYQLQVFVRHSITTVVLVSLTVTPSTQHASGAVMFKLVSPLEMSKRVNKSLLTLYSETALA